MFFVHTNHNTYTAETIAELAGIFDKKKLHIKPVNSAIKMGTQHISILAEKGEIKIEGNY